MSSYWAGYSGIGMVLTVPEFNELLEVYKQKNPEEIEAVNEAAENCDFADTGLIMSKFAGEKMPGLHDGEAKKYEGKIMYIMEMCDDYIDGVTFWPFYKADGSKNIPWKNSDGMWEEPEGHHPIWESDETMCYVLYANKALDSVNAFDEKPYASYEAFVQEFKDKVEAYLPEDFNWNAHLGNVNYAAFG